MPAPRLVLLTTSSRVVPGLLTLAAWDALRLGPVLTADPASATAAAVLAEGIAVRVVDDVADAVTLARAEGRAVWLVESGTADPEPGVSAELADGVEVEVLVGSRDLPGARLLDAVAVMDRLRSPGGCPWDAEQSHTSLAPYLLEEAYEAYQAIEDGQIADDLREELGDVLLQVLFHARLAQESNDAGWDVDDVAGDLVDKLVRRHPHVFGTVTAVDSGAVEANWDAIKKAEKRRSSITEGVPLGQPALSLAAKLIGRAQKAGLPTTLDDPAAGADEAELLGRALFGLVARARANAVDPEAALRGVARGYAGQLRAVEGADSDGLRRPGR